MTHGVLKGCKHMDNIQNETFYNKVIELFQSAKANLATAVNMTMVYSYYEAGRMIVEEEQDGKERAAYGSSLYERLALSRDKEEVMRLAKEGQMIEKSNWMMKTQQSELSFTKTRKMLLCR